LPVSADQVSAMSTAIAHRGPDAVGSYTKEGPGYGVHLGHRRLSIIDLSEAANQPFVKDGLALTFCGEIYNYRALQHELRAMGVAFRTTSDTEVLLEAWRHWGPECLGRLRGMFAFALFDERTGTLVLARDHFGIKPLFYAERGGGLVFASELKALRPVLEDRWDVDPTAVVASLMYCWRRPRTVASACGATTAFVTRSPRLPVATSTCRRSARCSRTRWQPTWLPTCPFRPSCPEAWTPAC
jgi:asparagine synthase (glutamine-hydrolysing)